MSSSLQHNYSNLPGQNRPTPGPSGEHLPNGRMFSSLGTRVVSLFGIDLRSLAVFRMALGALLLADLSIRVQDLSAHYTDWGVLPRDVLVEHFANPLHLSLHLATGSTLGQALLFLMAGVFALALLLGFRTPVATCASWLLLLSVQARNPMVLHSSDTLARMLLFWGMFIPLGARYSLDSLFRCSDTDRTPLPTSVRSAGTVALLLQICLMYWCTVASKSWEVWWYEASAVYYALSMDQFVTSLGRWLLGFPELMAPLSRATIALQLVGPCLVFVPFFTPWLRLCIIGAFFSFHLGLALCLNIGAFPYISMVVWLVFVPDLVWERGRFLLLKMLRRRSLAGPSALNSAAPGPSLAQASGVSSSMPHPLRASRRSQILAAFFLVYVVAWNLHGLEATSPYAQKIFPPYSPLVGHVLRLDQSWRMFSMVPYPTRDDGWFVLPGMLKDGRSVELWTGRREVSWEKPQNVSALYRNDRWWKYTEKIYPYLEKGREPALRAWAGYMCRDWNARHRGREQLETLEIFFMQETTLPDYQQPSVEKKLLWTHACVAPSQ